MTETIENLFIYLVFLFDLLVLFLIFFFIKREKRNKNFLILSTYCSLDLIINTITEFPIKEQMYLIYSVFTLSEYILFATLLWFNIKKAGFKKIIIISSLVFTSFLIIYYLTVKPRSIDSIPIGIETILILIFSFYYLLEQMNDMSDQFVYSRYHFWFVIGIMIYLAGSFFIYIFANQVDRDTLAKYWFLTNMFYTLKNILFAIGILTYVKQLKNPRPEKLYPYLN